MTTLPTLNGVYGAFGVHISVIVGKMCGFLSPHPRRW